MKYTNVDITLADMLREALQIERGGLPLARRRCLSFSRIICLNDKTAAEPNWWWSNRLRYFDPELTTAEIAELLNIPRSTVVRLLRDVPIGEDVYAALPDRITLELLKEGSR